MSDVEQEPEVPLIDNERAQKRVEDAFVWQSMVSNATSTLSFEHVLCRVMWIIIIWCVIRFGYALVQGSHWISIYLWKVKLIPPICRCQTVMMSLMSILWRKLKLRIFWKCCWWKWIVVEIGRVCNGRIIIASHCLDTLLFQAKISWNFLKPTLVYNSLWF